MIIRHRSTLLQGTWRAEAISRTGASITDFLSWTANRRIESSGAFFHLFWTRSCHVPNDMYVPSHTLRTVVPNASLLILEITV